MQRRHLEPFGADQRGLRLALDARARHRPRRRAADADWLQPVSGNCWTCAFGAVRRWLAKVQPRHRRRPGNRGRSRRGAARSATIAAKNSGSTRARPLALTRASARSANSTRSAARPPGAGLVVAVVAGRTRRARDSWRATRRAEKAHADSHQWAIAPSARMPSSSSSSSSKAVVLVLVAMAARGRLLRSCRIRCGDTISAEP